MYICFDCGLVFENLRCYTERHGLDDPPYETYYGCPECGGAYGTTMCCDGCGEWIRGEYVEVKGSNYCENCFKLYEIH